MSGPFEAIGIGDLIAAGLLFVVISALKILPAYRIWNLRWDGVVLALILLGLSLLFLYGFALPLALLMGISQVVIMRLAWKCLNQQGRVRRKSPCCVKF